MVGGVASKISAHGRDFLRARLVPQDTEADLAQLLALAGVIAVMPLTPEALDVGVALIPAIHMETAVLAGEA